VTGSTRLFFAAWPAPEIQRALGDLGRTLQRQCGGKALPARNIHLTLVFLGDVARERLAPLETLAAAVTAPRFDLEVDCIEYWRHNRIVGAGVTRAPKALLMLVERLERGLSSAGFRFDERAYVPHVTLLRNARRAPPEAEMPAVAWPVARFALVESVPRGKGRAYEVLREWPLAA
jgi:2'-5' RNA ligase